MTELTAKIRLARIGAPVAHTAPQQRAADQKQAMAETGKVNPIDDAELQRVLTKPGVVPDDAMAAMRAAIGVGDTVWMPPTIVLKKYIAKLAESLPPPPVAVPLDGATRSGMKHVLGIADDDQVADEAMVKKLCDNATGSAKRKANLSINDREELAMTRVELARVLAINDYSPTARLLAIGAKAVR